jgi:hypothetical protein
MSRSEKKKRYRRSRECRADPSKCKDEDMSMCHELSVCRNEVRQEAAFFENYSLKYKVGEEVVKKGGSGVAVLLHFEKTVQGKDDRKLTLTGKALMKVINSEKGKMADNLFHEAMVGRVVNKFANVFPCFIRTFGMFSYRDPAKSAYTVQGIGMELLTEMPTVAETCETAGRQAILVEYIEGKPLKELYKSKSFLQTDIYEVLFMIYYPLAMLSEEYTHYDLHTGNVMLVEIKKGRFVKVVVVKPHGDPIVFYTRFIPKIIDYGRNYVRAIRTQVNEVKTDKRCNELCGENFRDCGYINLENPKNHIAFEKRNMSQDMRLLNYVAQAMEKEGLWDTKEQKVVFDPKGFSTEENHKNGYLKHKKIVNVQDAANFLATKVARVDLKGGSSPDLYGTLTMDGKNPWKFEVDEAITAKYESSKSSSSSSKKKSSSSESSSSPSNMLFEFKE